MKFYLGLHQPADVEKIRYPVFISVSRLLHRAKPVEHDDWLMDSGGFTMISQHGYYTISEDQYLSCIQHHKPNMAFCQDWMCEPFVLEKTGLTIEEHQRRTLESYLSLAAREPRVRPVIQGWAPKDYVRHAHDYAKSGVSMDQLFGLGTVCSRNGKEEAILLIVTALHEAFPGIKLHGFGLKTTALHNESVTSRLSSSDSMAWSSRGRRSKLCAWECRRSSCANCLEYALLWRRHVVDGMNQYHRKGILGVIQKTSNGCINGTKNQSAGLLLAAGEG